MQGFETVTAPAARSTTDKGWRSLAQVAQADACVELNVTEGQPTVTLWLACADDDPSLSLSIAGTTEEETTTVLPLRAVELLRTGLLERLERRAAAMKAKPTATVSVPSGRVSPLEPPREPVGHNSARLGLGLTFPSLSLSPAPGIEASVARRFGHALELAAVTVLPLGSSSVQATRATAFAKVHQFGIELRAVRGLGTTGVSLEAALGLGSAYILANSEASAPLESRRVTAWTASVQLSAGAWYSLGKRVMVGGTARLSTLLPRPAILVDDQIQPIGGPVATLCLGSTVRF